MGGLPCPRGWGLGKQDPQEDAAAPDSAAQAQSLGPPHPCPRLPALCAGQDTMSLPCPNGGLLGVTVWGYPRSPGLRNKKQVLEEGPQTKGLRTGPRGVGPGPYLWGNTPSQGDHFFLTGLVPTLQAGRHVTSRSDLSHNTGNNRAEWRPGTCSAPTAARERNKLGAAPRCRPPPPGQEDRVLGKSSVSEMKICW